MLINIEIRPENLIVLVDYPNFSNVVFRLQFGEILSEKLYLSEMSLEPHSKDVEESCFSGPVGTHNSQDFTSF